MAKSKYYFNQETLSYEKVNKNLSKKLIGFMSFLFIVLVIAGGISAVFLKYYDTPGMKALRTENTQLHARYMALNEKLENIELVLDEIQVRDDNIYRVIFETEPIPESVRKAGFGGTDAYANLESFSNSDIALLTSKKIDIISKQAYIQAKSYEDVLKMAREKEEELSSVPAILPLSNEDLSYTSSGWGMRMHPVYKVPLFHYGIDFVAPKGANVYATGNGVVSSVRTLRNGHGKHVVIDHGFGYETLYAHLNSFNVKNGDKVQRGQVIGFVGSTGTSTAPHLHYEVHKDGRIVNPNHYFFKDLTPHEFEQLVAISSNIKQSFD
jgi:murein DD-endopeptidase MepM/ murein hydrolase activator NlpD